MADQSTDSQTSDAAPAAPADTRQDAASPTPVPTPAPTPVVPTPAAPAPAPAADTRQDAASPTAAQLARVQKERDALNTQLQETQGQLHNYRVDQVLGGALAAPNEGIKDPKTVAQLVDRSRIGFDEAGKPTGLKEELARVKALLPHLFYSRAASADAGATGAPPTDDANDWLRRRMGSR